MSSANAIWNGSLTGINITEPSYGGVHRQMDNSLSLILDIVNKFDVPFSIRKYEEGTPGQLTYFNGSMLSFGGVEYKIYSGQGFGNYEKDQVTLKLAAMYPEKILTPEEMKKRFYKDALKEEK